MSSNTDDAWNEEVVQKYLMKEKKDEGISILSVISQKNAMQVGDQSPGARMLFYTCFLAIVDRECIQNATRAADSEKAIDFEHQKEWEKEERILRAACQTVHDYFEAVDASINEKRRLFESNDHEEQKEFNRAAVIARYFELCDKIRTAIFNKKDGRNPLPKELDGELNALKRDREPFKKVIADIMSNKDGAQLLSDFQALREKVPALQDVEVGFKDGMSAFEMLEVLVLEDAWEREMKKVDEKGWARTLGKVVYHGHN